MSQEIVIKTRAQLQARHSKYCDGLETPVVPTFTHIQVGVFSCSALYIFTITLFCKYVITNYKMVIFLHVFVYHFSSK